MKLPNLPKLKRAPKSSGSSKASVPSIRVPAAVEDLYRDMRDRRLLLPALALIVAIIAVPVMLKSPEEAAPAAAQVALPEGADAVSPAVLAEQPVGVRDYRKRLDELKSKDPFAGSFTSPVDSQAVGDGELAPAPVESPPADSAPVTPSEPPSSDTSMPPPDEPPASGDDGSDTGDDELLILAPRIDVRGGKVGERKRIKDVGPGELLPSRRWAPVVMFLGASDNLKYAHFLVSDGVIETEGDGTCRPNSDRCEFLRLKEDEKQYFTFGADEARYSLKVTEIREEIVDERKVDGA
jgi:hypothetical protein